MFKCDQCGFTTDNPDEADQHEAQQQGHSVFASAAMNKGLVGKGKKKSSPWSGGKGFGK